MADDPTPQPQTPFTDLLHELRSGDAMKDASALLTQLITDIQAVGKGGSLTLTLSIAPVTKGNTTTLVVVEDIKVKPPKIDSGSTIVFATDKGELSRRDPRQPKLPTMEPPRLAEVRNFHDHDAAASNDE